MIKRYFEKRTCIICSSIFKCRKDSYTKTCSRECCYKSFRHKLKKAKPKICKMCFNGFVPKTRTRHGKDIALYCSWSCFVANSRERMRTRCKNCSKEFIGKIKLDRKGIKYRQIFCSQKCSYSFNSGERHFKWIGGLAKDGNTGYIKNTIKEKRQHRVVMEEFLGRPLNINEHVHHINHIKNDNRIENIQIVTPSEHKALHNRLRKIKCDLSGKAYKNSNKCS